MNVKLTTKQKIEFANTDEVYNVLQAVLMRENHLSREKEHFWVMGLNNANKLLFMELVALGGDNRLHAKAPEVFRMAIHKTATQVILAHNHPNGKLLISPTDTEFADRLLKAGKLINIDVIDYFIISEIDYKSFSQEGIIHELRHNGNYELVRRQEKMMEELRLEMEREKAEREGKLKVAAKLKAEGMDETFIKRMTGLRLGEIRKL